jgi:hypothetical protein
VIARERGVPIGEISTYRPRAPYKPITSARSPGVEAKPHQIAE